MFIQFFYDLRREKVAVAPTEWLTLLQALQLGLAGNSLTGFYYLARSILIKSETQYDAYDRAFLSCFKGIETPPEVTDQVLEWLQNALPPLLKERHEKRPELNWSLDELRKQLARRLEQQKEQHHGGSHWIGTGGTSPFGHSGYHPAGVRIGGDSVNKSAVKVAAERAYQDFRTDETLSTRQFELALRKLRLLSTAVEGDKDLLDIDSTVHETGKQAGRLELVFTRERKNKVKLVVLMDSGGSMNHYQRLSSRLFNAAHKSTHFQDLQFYYFHNCVYELIFNDPFCMRRNSVLTYDFLRLHSQDYRLVVLGDASMGPAELLASYGALEWGSDNEEPGLVWLKRLFNHFEHSVWLNPIPKPHWKLVEGAYTINIIRETVPMFELTLDGLNQAVKKLMVKK